MKCRIEDVAITVHVSKDRRQGWSASCLKQQSQAKRSTITQTTPSNKAYGKLKAAIDSRCGKASHKPQAHKSKSKARHGTATSIIIKVQQSNAMWSGAAIASLASW